MNSHILKITRNAELPESLEIGNEYKVLIDGEVTGISKDDQDDGSFSFTYKMQLRSVELIDNVGKVIKSKDNKKQSVKLRGQIAAFGLDYDQTMTSIRHYLPEILVYIEKLRNHEASGLSEPLN